MPKISLYDATLRDGMQGEGMSLTVTEKLKVVHALDDLGVGFIEAGFPSSNPKEIEVFELLEKEKLNNAEICAFGMTRRRGVKASEDEGLKVMLECFAPICTLVGKTWSLHIEKVIKVDRDENLRMIEESVSYLVEQGKRVIYDAEHFFDAYNEDAEYALKCLKCAVEGGAENITICDTNGATLPSRVGEITARVVKDFGEGVEIGIHTHNDSDCGTATTIAAVESGARLVQGTINGYGERTGNANLMSILPALQLKLGYRVVSDEQVASLTEVSHFMDEVCNMTPNSSQAYVGRSAFAHGGGLHVAGVMADPRTFEHIDPALVGNSRDALVSELSGKGTIKSRARDAGIELDSSDASKIVEKIGELEHHGYHFEAADASFDLLLRRETGCYERLFELESFRVLTEKREDGDVLTEATIKIDVDGERYIRTAEGNGPVNALDNALRDAIVDRYPHLKDIELVNYKVRILDEHKGTAAVTRVLLDASDGQDTWGSIGVSENIIEASWEALVDSLEYAMQPGRKQHQREGRGSDDN